MPVCAAAFFIVFVLSATSALADGFPPTWVSDYGTPITQWTGDADDGLAVVNLNGGNTGFSFNYDGSNYLSATISTNGFITLGASPANSLPAPCASALQPCANALTSNPPMIALAWYDVNSISSGSIYFNNTVPGEAVFTWLNVASFAPPGGLPVPGSDLASFQLILNQNGSIVFSYDQFNSGTSMTGSSAALIGFSKGNNTSDPGAAAVSLLTSPNTFMTGSTFYTLVNPANPVDLSGLNFVFTPAANNTWNFTNSRSSVEGIPEPATVFSAASGLAFIALLIWKVKH